MFWHAQRFGKALLIYVANAILMEMFLSKNVFINSKCNNFSINN